MGSKLMVHGLYDFGLDFDKEKVIFFNKDGADLLVNVVKDSIYKNRTNVEFGKNGFVYMSYYDGGIFTKLLTDTLGIEFYNTGVDSFGNPSEMGALGINIPKGLSIEDIDKAIEFNNIVNFLKSLEFEYFSREKVYPIEEFHYYLCKKRREELSK